MLLLLLLTFLSNVSSHSRFHNKPTTPSIQIFDNFFNTSEIQALHQLAYHLEGENVWYTPSELLDKAADIPAYEWIHDIVLQHSPDVRIIEIWAQYYSNSIEWHTDKDEELYHRNRVLHAPEKSFVVYVKEGGLPETRGLLICSNDPHQTTTKNRYCSQYDRFSPLRGRLIIFDPDLPHRAEKPVDPHLLSSFPNGHCPGPIHLPEKNQRGWRSILFNAWTKHMPEAILNESSRDVLYVSKTGGWTATGPFSDGDVAIQVGKLGTHLRKNMHRRLRPGSYELSYHGMTKKAMDATVDLYIEKTVGQEKGRQQALHFAARVGATKSVIALIQANTFIDYVRKEGSDSFLTPLHAAAASGSVATVRVLLNYGSGANGLMTTLDRDGRSVLHVSVLALAKAAKRNVTRRKLVEYRKVVDLLANAGSHADPVTRRILLKYWGSVHPKEEASPEKIEEVAVEVDIENNENNENEPLCIAAAQGDQQKAEDILSKASNTSKTILLSQSCLNYGHFNPLRVAACKSRGNIVKYLLEQGADPNVQQIYHGESDTETSTYPLHCAAMRGDVWSTISLLSANATVNVVDRWGRTPLHLASEQIQPPMRVNRAPSINAYQHVISSLLEYNATVNSMGYTKIVPYDGTTRHNLLRAGVAEKLLDL